MNIKVECPCGTAFEFEVEPENGQMPCAVPCPNCGRDGTAEANTAIQQTLNDESNLAAPPLPGAGETITPAPELRKPRPIPISRAAWAANAPAPAPEIIAPKAKPTPAYGEPNMKLGTLGALIGGLVGMAVWYALIKFAHLESGLIAIGVGGLVGFGCRILGGGYSRMLGFIAASCAVVAIVGGRYFAVRAFFDDAVGKFLESAYTTELSRAHRAVTLKTDEEIRASLAEEKSEPNNTVTPASIKRRTLRRSAPKNWTSIRRSSPATRAKPSSSNK